MQPLDPQIAKDISESAAGKTLIAYLAGLALSLDTLEDIDLTDPVEATIEMKARQRAKSKIESALTSLLVSGQTSTMKDARDSFAVEVDPPKKD